MAKVFKALILLFFAASFITACKKKEETPPAAPSANSGPTLKVGYKWTYKETRYNEDGTVDGTPVIYTETITGDTVINGSTWYIHSGGGFVQYRSDGFWTLFMGSQSIRYKFPATVDETYSVTTIPGKIQTMKVLSTATSITAVPGTYSCYHYKDIADAEKPEEYFFEPNTGVIRSEEYTLKSDGSNQFYIDERRELLSFEKN